MGIQRIEIRNCKSIKDVDIPIANINLIIGQNGVGKSNILRLIEYFYGALSGQQNFIDILDRNNPFNSFGEIAITYNFDKLSIISKAQINQSLLYNKPINPIFKRISLYIKQYSFDNTLIKLSLKQYKDNRIKWNINDYEFRILLKDLFPIYSIQARNTELTNWETLWNIIGDLGKSKSNDNIKELLGEEVSNLKDLDYLKNLFYLANVELATFTPTQKLAHLYQLLLGGKDYQYNTGTLDFFSDGFNSYNYLKLFCTVTNTIARGKLKKPIILIDEPEVGLHPNFAQELTDCFITQSDTVKFILATHSPRIVKKVIQANGPHNIFHVSMKNDYSLITKMNTLFDHRTRHFISDEEAGYYFSKAIVFIEGETEKELFEHPILRKYFPMVENVDFFPIKNNVKMEIVNPAQRKMNIPYLIILDLDKIIDYNKKTKKFVLRTKEPTPIKSTNKKFEELYYGNLRIRTLETRKRIQGMTRTFKFNFNEHWGFGGGKSFKLYKRLIHSYCMQYCVYTLDSTVEGLLINSESCDLAYQWIIHKFPKNRTLIDDILSFCKSEPSYKCTILRLLVNGKYDNLNTRDQLLKDVTMPPHIDDLYKKIDKVKVKKTSGWVTEYLDYFFEIFTEGMDAQEKRKQFYTCFKEFSDLIKYIQDLTIGVSSKSGYNSL